MTNLGGAFLGAMAAFMVPAIAAAQPPDHAAPAPPATGSTAASAPPPPPHVIVYDSADGGLFGDAHHRSPGLAAVLSLTPVPIDFGNFYAENVGWGLAYTTGEVTLAGALYSLVRWRDGSALSRAPTAQPPSGGSRSDLTRGHHDLRMQADALRAEARRPDGRPGAGKTAVLETIRRHFCVHVLVLPEAANIVFGGGFPRQPILAARCAAQRAIYHVARQLERAAIEAREARGTIDGVAYWPLDEDRFWTDVRSSAKEELARYAAVIQLRTPSLASGYDRSNPLRIESPSEATVIDSRVTGRSPRSTGEAEAAAAPVRRAVAEVDEQAAARDGLL